MPQVSSHALKKVAQDKLFNELACYIGRTGKNNAFNFLETLLTPTEQIMLGKRIGVIALLHNGASTYQIIKKLHMSPTTVVRMNQSYKKGEYEAITRLFNKSKKDWERFMKVLEVVLRGGLPPRVGARWKFLDSRPRHTG